MAQKRDLRPVLSKDLTDAVEQVILDAADAGIDLDDIEDSPRIRGKLRKDDTALNNLVSIKSQGSPIPGQSLTNDPEQPYPWERPPEFANPREALDDILSSLLQPEAVKEIINSLVNGASVGDLAMAIVYAKFVEGKINPDVMMLSMEPVMYLIMSIGEEANIEYNIDNDDIDGTLRVRRGHGKRYSAAATTMASAAAPLNVRGNVTPSSTSWSSTTVAFLPGCFQPRRGHICESCESLVPFDRQSCGMVGVSWLLWSRPSSSLCCCAVSLPGR